MTSIIDVACFKCKYTNVPTAEEPCKSCDDKEFHGNFKPAHSETDPEVKTQ